MKYLYFLCLILILHTGNITAQQVDTTREFIRRTDLNSQPPTTYYQQPKEQVFPLGWNKGTLGKVTSGTGVWTELNPKVPRVSYFGIDFINPDTGWACGQSGAVIKTTNGGDDWSISQTPVTNLLLKIHSYNGQVVICTGYDGIILRSTDGGENFVQVASGVGTGTDLWGVQMVNDTLGWVCGMNQTLLKTTDAGQTWQQVYPGLNQHYWSLDFLNEQYGIIAAGGGKVLKTTDGGNSWQQRLTGDNRPLYTIDLIDSLHIAAAGEYGNQIQYEGGKNVYSSDGGESWILNPDIPTYDDANWIEYVDIDTGYSINLNYGIYKTTNRGQSWVGVGGGGQWHIDMVGYQIGYSGGEGLNFYKRTNGLENWSKIFLNVDWSDVFFINEMKGFFISSYYSVGLYKTEDGGINYQKVENSPEGNNDLLFLDSLTGFIGSNTIYKTTDGGENWFTVNGVPGGVTKIFFINNTTGWAIGGSTIFKTTDGGENWFSQLTLPSGHFTSIFFVDSLNGWATSRYIWQTTDGGENWIEDTDIPTFYLLDVFFKDYLNGFILSSNKFYSTTDGGTTWVLNPNLTGFSVAGKFSYYGDSTIFIIGYKTFRSTDGGDNWEEVVELDGNKITGLSLLNPGLGYAIGELGLILNYYDDSIPVELSSFNGSYISNSIELKWTTETELNNSGFEILRSKDLSNWESIGFVPGRGTTTSRSLYTFYDSHLIGNHFFYKLKQIDFDGSYSFSEIIKVEIQINNYSLSQNYPNPANPKTRITFSIPEKTIVKINLYSITGELIKELMDEEKENGIYQIDVDLNNYSSGMYFYRMTTNSGYTATKKLILLK